MKRYIVVLVCIALLIICSVSLADVPLESSYFEDPVFLEEVKIQFNTVWDNILSDAEIAAADSLVISEKGITSLKGIEYLTNLERLGCHSNKLTSVDLSKNTKLVYLEIWDNQLKSLDVKANTALTHLSCEDNQISSLDLSQNTALKELFCNGNKIETLNVSKCPALCDAMDNNKRYITYIGNHHRFGGEFHFDANVTVIGRYTSKPSEATEPPLSEPTTPSSNPTTPGPDTTTPGPTPTTPGPDTTTPGPDTTTPGPAPTTPAPIEGDMKWADVHYSFKNTKEGLDYQPSDISERVYIMLYGEILGRLRHDWARDRSFGGWCSGFAHSSILFNTKGSELNLIAFGAKKVSELKLDYVSAGYGMTVKELIEFFQLISEKREFENAKVWDNLDSLVQTVKDGIKNGRLPFIGIHYPAGGKDRNHHALVPYKLSYVNPTTERLFVYDSNDPTDETGSYTYITLTKDANGKYIKWAYNAGGQDIGTDDKRCRISYIENSKLSGFWKSRPKSRATEQEGLALVSGDNWQIVSGASVLAEMKNGVFTSYDGKIEKDTLASVADGYTLLYIKNAEFSVINTGSQSSFMLAAASYNQSVIVKTSSGSVTFDMNDSSNKNTAILDCQGNDTFEAEFRSILPAASGKETIVISGKGEGAKVVVGLSGSDVVVNNCTDVSITVNDQPVQNPEEISKNINFYEISLEYTEAAYAGKEIRPGIIVKEHDLKEGTDYTITYENNVGSPDETTTAAAVIQGTGEYTGTKTLLFTIVPGGKDLKNSKISSIKDQVYTGKAITPKFSVTYQGTKLVKDTDYTIEWKNNQKIGTATLTVYGKGMCIGEKSVTFKIIPKAVKLSSLKAGSKQLTVKWKKGSGIDGYEIEYSLKKNFKGAKTVTISKAKTTSTEIKKLKAKKTYYVRIRTYKKVKGKKYYSEWSKTLKKKTK